MRCLLIGAAVVGLVACGSGGDDGRGQAPRTVQDVDGSTPFVQLSVADKRDVCAVIDQAALDALEDDQLLLGVCVVRALSAAEVAQDAESACNEELERCQAESASIESDDIMASFPACSGETPEACDFAVEVILGCIDSNRRALREVASDLDCGDTLEDFAAVESEFMGISCRDLARCAP